ncbi:MAG: hypothetical protein H0U17_03645 [Actinobacteria bacterium]|nr:hypothetical protein [Actinomycetota bacterium]
MSLARDPESFLLDSPASLTLSVRLSAHRTRCVLGEQLSPVTDGLAE